MPRQKLFIDTHDRKNGSFPPGLTVEPFERFFETFEDACAAEGVTILRVHAGFAEGRAFCLTMAADADAVRRAHERVGLPFDSITEVTTATPGDAFFRRQNIGN